MTYYFTRAKKTTTPTFKKTYYKPPTTYYVYKPTVYKPTKLYIPMYIAPKLYIPTYYIAPKIYIASTSYYKPTTVALLNIGQTCSSNVGCLSSCCKSDSYGWKTCSSSISCATKLISTSNTYYVYTTNVNAAAGAAGSAMIIMICMPCIIIGCIIWCCCKFCKNNPQTVVMVQ